MYRECPADLSMVRVILGDGYYDEHIHSCQVIRYIPDNECIYSLSETAELSVFTLDALYECEIRVGDEMLKCQGFITERYNSKQGKVLVFRIQNGFYKNPVN